MGSATHTVTPPTAFDMAMTPLNSIFAAYPMFKPVRFSTVDTAQASPP